MRLDKGSSLFTGPNSVNKLSVRSKKTCRMLSHHLLLSVSLSSAA